MYIQPFFWLIIINLSLIKKFPCHHNFYYDIFLKYLQYFLFFSQRIQHWSQEYNTAYTLLYSISHITDILYVIKCSISVLIMSTGKSLGALDKSLIKVKSPINFDICQLLLKAPTIITALIHYVYGYCRIV